MDDYYSGMASGYDELYGEEQKAKAEVVMRNVKLVPPVLDIGCGTGIVDLGRATIGIDPSIGLLKHHKGLRVCAKAEALPFKDSSFSSIVSLTALHHADIDKAIDEIMRVARSDAVIAITVLKKASNFSEIVSKLKDRLGLEEIDQEKDLILVKH